MQVLYYFNDCLTIVDSVCHLLFVCASFDSVDLTNPSSSILLSFHSRLMSLDLCCYFTGGPSWYSIALSAFSQHTVFCVVLRSSLFPSILEPHAILPRTNFTCYLVFYLLLILGFRDEMLAFSKGANSCTIWGVDLSLPLAKIFFLGGRGGPNPYKIWDDFFYWV